MYFFQVSTNLPLPLLLQKEILPRSWQPHGLHRCSSSSVASAHDTEPDAETGLSINAGPCTHLFPSTHRAAESPAAEPPEGKSVCPESCCLPQARCSSTPRTQPLWHKGHREQASWPGWTISSGLCNPNTLLLDQEQTPASCPRHCPACSLAGGQSCGAGTAAQARLQVTPTALPGHCTRLPSPPPRCKANPGCRSLSKLFPFTYCKSSVKSEPVLAKARLPRCAAELLPWHCHHAGSWDEAGTKLGTLHKLQKLFIEQLQQEQMCSTASNCGVIHCTNKPAPLPLPPSCPLNHQEPATIPLLGGGEGSKVH